MQKIIDIMIKNKYLLLLLGIIIYIMYKQTKESFYGLDFLDSKDYLQCCQKWGCGSWACQQLLLYKKPLIKYVGTIYSTTMPQKIYSMYKKYNNQTASYDYLYRDRNNKFGFIKLNNDKIKEGFNVSPRYGIHRLIKGDFDTNIKPYSLFYGYNVGHKINYDHYYPPLYNIYKRPVHYSVDGDFMTTIGKYGILRPINIENTETLDLYEREIRPNLNEYQYFIKMDEIIIELPNSYKINDGAIIELPGTDILYKLEITN